MSDDGKLVTKNEHKKYDYLAMLWQWHTVWRGTRSGGGCASIHSVGGVLPIQGADMSVHKPSFD